MFMITPTQKMGQDITTPYASHSNVAGDRTVFLKVMPLNYGTPVTPEASNR